MSSAPHPEGATPLEAPEVRILRLQPGDEIVLTLRERATKARADDIRNYAQERWPEHRVTVLSEGIDMEVLRGSPE